MISDTSAESDIIYLNLLGQPVIVLNSVKAAVDLLDKRGTVYSDRPPFILLEAYGNAALLSKTLLTSISSLGFKNNLALTGDGAQFRKLRKAYGGFLSARNSLAYRNSQLKYARMMAREIEKCPEKWHTYLSQCGFSKQHLSRKAADECFRFATRVIFSMAFAIDVADEHDPYFKLADKMGWIISNMGSGAITILDIAPWRKYALSLWLIVRTIN